MRGLLSQQFSVAHLNDGDFLDAFADIVCTCQCSIQQVVASLDHLSTPRIQCNHCSTSHLRVLFHDAVSGQWSVVRRYWGPPAAVG